MKDEQIRAVALDLASKLSKDGKFHWDGSLFDLVDPLLADINAKAEPVFEVGFGWLKTKSGNITPCPNGTLLYTHPAIDHAPQQETIMPGRYKGDALDKPACAAPLPDEVTQMVERLRQHALPDPQDEREVLHAPVLKAAANLIERLAKQVQDASDNLTIAYMAGAASAVPDGCVVVPREPTDAMLVELFRGYTTRELAYKSMIAAGEAKL